MYWGFISFALAQDTTQHIISTGPTLDTTQTRVSSIKSTKDSVQNVAVRFFSKEVLLEESDIISNVLVYHNLTDDIVTFTAKISTPYEWEYIGNTDMQYAVKPGDSVFIPIRVIPSEIKGGAYYAITAYLVTIQGGQAGSASFFAHTKKISKWTLGLQPGNKVYFLRNEDTASFQIDISNEGNQPQEILTTIKTSGSGVIMDTNGKILHKNYYDMQINPEKDTTLSFKFKYNANQPNFRVTDVENYTPANGEEMQIYQAWVSSQEAQQASDPGSQAVIGKEISFIKLPDILKANPFSSEVFPLTMDINVYGILGIQPIMSVNLFGNDFLANQAHLVYSLNLNYSSYYFQNNFLRNDQFYAGYFDKRGSDIQIGNIGEGYSYGLPIGGFGIKGDYVIDKQNAVGGLVSEGGYNSTAKDFAVWDKYRFMNFTPLLNNVLFTTTAAGYTNIFTKVNAYIISESGGLNLGPNQGFSFSVSDITKDYYGTATPVIFSGLVYNLGYNGVFFNRKLIFSDYFYHGSYDTSRNNRNIIVASNSTLYRINRTWGLQLRDIYNSYPSPQYSYTPTTFSFSNTLYLVRSGQGSSLLPYVFYNYSAGSNVGLLYRGIGGRYSYFDYFNNILMQAGVQGGYNHLYNFPIPFNDYFTAQPNLLLRYHTTTFLAYYNYGPTGIPNLNSFSSEYPQSLMLSLFNQHQFFNKHFVLENAISYSYFTQLENSSISYSPEAYYFTNSGWRFKVGFSYGFTSSNAGASIPIYSEDQAPATTVVSSSIYVNIGIKKNFGIPLPKKWAKHEYRKITFMAFFDANGDGKKEDKEVAIDNVVIHLGNRANTYEVITNDEGQARMLNIEVGRYYQSITPLRPLNGWFINVLDTINIGGRDTIYVPFTKGVKINGAVIYHASKYSVQNQIDLSRVQVTATDSLGRAFSTLTDANGEYILFVPNGKFSLTMNEEWMGDHFVVAENNIPLTLTPGIDNIYQSFYISEKATKAEIKQFGTPTPPVNTVQPPDDVPRH